LQYKRTFKHKATENNGRAETDINYY